MSGKSLTSWLHGCLLAMLLTVSYFGAWRPVRMEIMATIVHPVLHAATATSANISVTLNEASGVIHVMIPEDGGYLQGRMAAPAGFRFLLPALALVVLAPRRPFWLYFWTGHLALSAFMMLGWMLSLQGVTVASYLSVFIRSYVLDAYGIVATVLVWKYAQSEEI